MMGIRTLASRKHTAQRALSAQAGDECTAQGSSTQKTPNAWIQRADLSSTGGRKKTNKGKHELFIWHVANAVFSLL